MLSETPMKKMKDAKFVQLLAVGLVVTLGVVGCSKNPQRTTTIPGHGANSIQDTLPSGPRNPLPANPINTGDGTAGQNPISAETLKNTGPEGTGLAAAKGDISGWDQNRTEFAAQTVHFEFDKATIRPGDVSKLEEVARRMKSSFQGKALLIEGHCDERGTEEYNRSLGDRRALSVREKLAQLGLDAEVVHTISFGEEKPTDPGHNEAAWSANRRGELILCSPPGAK
jgi:peptidoglycan-associated lipoprotein